MDRPTTDDASPPRRRRILVADDEPHIGRVIQLKLETAPYDVTLVGDGRAAMDLIETEEPLDLILLDIMMPHLTGLDVLREVRRMPHRKDTPVIILTAKGQDADRERALALGADDFLTKPFSPNKLLNRINELFA